MDLINEAIKITRRLSEIEERFHLLDLPESEAKSLRDEVEDLEYKDYILQAYFKIRNQTIQQAETIEQLNSVLQEKKDHVTQLEELAQYGVELLEMYLNGENNPTDIDLNHFISVLAK